MSFDGLRTSQFGDNRTCFTSDFAQTTDDGGFCVFFPDLAVRNSSTNLDLLREERLSERKRVARELHDTLLQGFLAVSMNLRAAVDRLSEDCSEKQRFSDVVQLLDRVLQEGRSVVQGLRSPAERVASIGEALARVPSDLGFPLTFNFRVVVLGRERELRDGLADEVFRIGHEAIINACRHSSASEISVEVEFRKSELRIVVRDNGCGIRAEKLHWGRNGHWGLQGMRERAERIGAWLRLSSKSGIGTEVELCVPARTAFAQPQTFSAQ